MPILGIAFSGGNSATTGSLVNSDASALTIGTLVYGGSAQGALTAGGSYVLVPSGLSSDLGYGYTYVNGALTINPTPLSVTASNASKTYDGVAYSYGYGVAYSGLVNSETASVLGGTLGYSGTSQSASNAGSYAITPGGLTNNNYTVSFVNGALTIAAAPLTVTASNASKAYDGVAYSGGNGVAYSGFVNSETSSALGGTLAYSGNSQGATAAGSYAITPSGLTSSNYALSFVNGALTINAVAPMAGGTTGTGGGDPSITQAAITFATQAAVQGSGSGFGSELGSVSGPASGGLFQPVALSALSSGSAGAGSSGLNTSSGLVLVAVADAPPLGQNANGSNANGFMSVFVVNGGINMGRDETQPTIAR